jgi:2',3'-cyclic-nucleotide 2'-phosphodiesterase (5'-nucleotidase family)
MADFTLQLFHAADQEGNISALDDAPRFSAVLNALKNQDIDADGVAGFANTLILSSGDAYIPGVFFNASTPAFGGAGRGDILIQNALGFQAIAFGNHEFDQGTTLVRDLIAGDDTFAGTAFPYLSSNLDFSTDANLAGLVVPDAEAPVANSIAASTVIEVNGESIGVVGATTPTISNVNVRISSPGNVTVLPQPFDGNPTSEQLDALAAEIQADVDALLAANPDINKVVLLAHMQQLTIEQELAQRLSNVDIIVAGGSNTRLLDETDRLRAGDTNQGVYPIVQTGADGNPVAVVNTDGNYKYVGRLVIDFDENGVLLPESYDPTISGAYATDDEGVAAVSGGGLADPAIIAITEALREIIIATESNVFGVSDVFLEGRRGAVRTEETNLGNLTADANLAVAREVDTTTVISLKNGGGIRNPIGQIIVPAGGTGDAELLPNEEIFGVKPAGGISQTDIENTLQFNNDLSLITVTAEELLALVETGVAGIAMDDSASPGAFPQISGFAFSFDATAEPGSRVRSLAIEDAEGNDIDVVVQNGEIVGDASRTFRMVTLSFLADGGDGYPFPTGETANRVDLVDETATPTGRATFAADFSEQDALAEFLLANFDNPDTPFGAEEVGRELDTRIQNLAFRSDGVIDTAGPVDPTPVAPSLLVPLGTYETGIFDESAAEIVVHDPVSQRLFVVNASIPAVDVLDVSDPSNPTKLFELDPSEFGSGANSVAIANGIVAVAVEAEEKTDPGSVVFFDIDGNFLKAVTVGALPDMVTFTPDGTKVLVANEGQPNDDYTVDPEGSISIIDLSGGIENLTQANVTTADFTAFNDQRDALIASGVRIFGPNATVAQDVEPEYIVVTSDSSTAYVALQENNALAVVDIASGSVTDILPLGFKDHSVVPLDASDRDGGINITTYPNLFGMYMPDAISLYEVGGETFIVTANEGDARDYDGFSEEARVKDLMLDPIAFPNAAELQADEALGRLTVTTTLGDANGDGLYEELYAFGGRSFSIFDTQGNLVYDSGAEFEQITAALFPGDFNANNDENGTFDNRSDNKGPEPEGVAIGEIDGRTYAFIGLERFGGIITYDITSPTEAFFVDFVNNRNFAGDAEAGTAGDLGPEGIAFISAANSPNGNPLLVVGNEVSGTTTVFDASGLVTAAPEEPTPEESLFLDLRDLTGDVTASFTVNREAAFDNFVGFYQVTDINGGIDLTGDGMADVNPGESGYTSAALDARAMDVALTTPNGSESVFESTVAGGSLYAPFLIANGNLNSFNSREVYFAFGAANADGVEHIRFANGALEFEDLFGGGDNDFNDVVVEFAVVA